MSTLVIKKKMVHIERYNMENKWQYWTGKHERVENYKWYLGIYKDKSGAISFIKTGEKFSDIYNQEINNHWLDESIGYFILQDIQE